MNTKMKMRTLSLLLCFVMLVGLVPTTVFAWTAPILSGNGGDAWNIQLSDEGVLSWNTISAATSYDIYVDKTAMGGTVTKIQGVTGTSYNLINRFKELKLENGTYYFQIKANGPNTTSPTISFKYVSPQDKLSEPRNLRWEGTIAKWDSVANATGYEVKLYTDDGYLQLSKTATTTQYDWTTEAADGRWFEVVATADNYRDSNPAEGPNYGTYSWTAPTLTGGKAEWNVQLSDDGRLKWNDMGSATYDIEVEKTAMGGTVTNIYSINTNTYNLINRFKTLKLENGTYYFTIKANDTSKTSGTISFRYVSPESKLSAPQNLRWDGTVAKWDSVANATGYTVILYTSSGSVQLNKTTSETQYNWDTEAADGRWFKVVATADNYRDSNAAESPKYVVVSYSIGAYPYDATVSQTQAGGQVYLSTDKGTDGWSSDGYIKKATEGTTVTLNANPAPGYKFVEWRQGTAGATISTDANYQFTASENKYLYAVFEAISTTEYQIELQVFDITYTANHTGGTVKVQTNKGSADGTNPKAYATKDTAVTITATPAAGYEFVAWKKWTPHNATAFSTDATYTFTATDTVVNPSENPPLFLYAVFQETQPQATTYEINCVSHNLSSNEIGGKVFLETDKGGTGYATSQQKYATENTTVRLIAVAEPGYQFVAWRKGTPTDANATVSTNTEYQFTATEAVWMYAVFEYTPDCTIECIPFDITGGINNGQSGVGGTVSIQTDKGTASGTITQSLKATRNSSVTVNAVAASGYEFLGWKKASPYVQDFVATTASYTFDINEELYLYAVFQEAANVPTYTVSFAANGGTGTMADVTGISGEYTLPENGFTAPDGKQFKAWSVSGTEKAVGDKITVTANTTVTAIWEAVEYNVTVTGGTASVGAGTPITKATMGTTVTLTADPAPSGKMFDKWVVTGVVVADANNATTTFVMPAGNVTAEATYKNAPHTHTFDQEIVKDAALKTAADCTHDAVYYKSCSCGAISTDDTDTFTAINSALGHAWPEEGSWSKDADKHWYECSRCHLKKDEAAHDYGDDDICDICTYDNSVPHTHNLTLVDENPATCTTPGNKAYYTCDGCDKWFEDASGSVEITDKTSVILTANGHTPSDWKFDADNHWKECTVVGCGVIIEDSKAAHTASDWIIDTEATATTDGTKHKECTECGYVMETGTIPATGSGEHTHSYGSDWKSNADKHWHECSCGDKAEEATHTASDWITDTAATATTDGTKHKECTECGYVMETGTIPATGGGEHTHSYSSDWKSDSINHWHECSCGVKDDVAAHSFKWVVDKEATATKKGSKHEECKFCGYQRPAVEIPVTGSTTKPTDPTESNPNTGALDDVPQTGDNNNNMILWIVLLLTSGLGVTITVVYSKRKKHAK